MQKIIPAILTADSEELRKQFSILRGNTNWLHIDIADGTFVKNQSISIFELQEAYKYFNLEIHLMVKNPERYFEDCDSMGAKRVIFHYEAVSNITETQEKSAHYQFHTGIALNPETKLEVLNSVKERISSLLLMSVHPGFQGQEFIVSSLEKAREARKMFPEMLIGIDGGIAKENIKEVFSAGASYAIVGSKIVKAENPVEALRELEEMIK